VPIDVAYHGTTQQITLQIPTINAYGEPEVQRKTLQVKIPKGMKEGQQIRLSGQGQVGIRVEPMVTCILKFVIKILTAFGLKAVMFM
jgi:DnaJ-class molecular chaperone